MGMTLVEKILQKKAGESVWIKADLCMINDGEGHKCIALIDEKKGLTRKENVIVILDHDIPAGSYDSAANQQKLIGFSQKYDLKFIQSAGIGYQILLDSYIKPGDIIASCGLHNSFLGAKGALGLNLGIEEMAVLLMEGSLDVKVPEAVKVVIKGALPANVYASDLIFNMLSEVGPKGFAGMLIEYTGEAVKDLSLNDKIVLCSMAAQTGAVSALINEEPAGDYAETFEYDLAKSKPIVTLPGDLYTAKIVDELKGVAVSAGFIGGCNSGRIEDLRIAAGILNGKRVKRGVRLLIGAASNAVHLQAMDEGLIETFIDCGAQVTNPGCGSCKTTSIGVVGDGEILLTTGSYNYPGCSGTENSRVYISSAAVVANAAITGFIS